METKLSSLATHCIKEKNMDYYLYSHSNADGIFYIGKGQSGRADKWGRTKEWKAIAAKGYTTKVEAHGTEVDILALERVVIKSLVKQGVELVNKHYNKHWDGFKGENNPMYGTHRSGKENPMFGKKHTVESRAKMGVNKGRKNPHLAIFNRQRYQRQKLAKANNYGGENEI